MAKKKLTKQERHDQRIRKARQWLTTYEGIPKKIIKHYRERFHLDTMTAIRDLQEIGVEFTQEYLDAVKRSEEERIRQKHAREAARKQVELAEEYADCDGRFAYIAGYTDGGAPFGLTWEEVGIDSMLPFEEKVRLYRSGEYPETWDEGGSCFGKGEDTAAYNDEELPFTWRGFDPEQAVPYVGIQYSATGVFGYSFRDEFDNEVVTVNSLVLPRPDIQITASGRKLWHRQFDGGITLAPGIRRNIEDENGKTAVYFEYMDIDAFRICIKKNQTLFVSVGPERWIISDGDDGVVALISRLAEDEREHFTENGLDMEERFLVEVMSDIDEELLPFICAVPVLGF